MIFEHKKTKPKQNVKAFEMEELEKKNSILEFVLRAYEAHDFDKITK